MIWTSSSELSVTPQSCYAVQFQVTRFDDCARASRASSCTCRPCGRRRGFDLHDRIVVRYDGDIGEVVERFEDTIAGELPAVRPLRGASDDTWRGQLNGVEAILQVERVRAT